MEFHHHRKLLPESFISNFCIPVCNITSYCEPACWTCCPTNCSCTNQFTDVFYGNPAPNPTIYQQDIHPEKSNKIPIPLVTSVAVFCALFLAVFFGAIYYRFYNRRTRRQSNQTRDGFLEEDHQGPILDHPIWYIRTDGLQPSIISSITVLNYKKGEGVVDGTDCSVCLSEFQEDETLRLLPKCNHAFHVSCIDTWLRSHTNCPLCRAPIVTSSTVRTTTPPQISVVSSASVEESQAGHSDEEGGVPELRVEEDEEGETTEHGGLNRVMEGYPRRSVSLDSKSAVKISDDLCNNLGGDEDFNGVEEEVDVPASSHCSVKNGRWKCGSSISKTSSTPMKRSCSWSGIILPSRHSRSQKTFS